MNTVANTTENKAKVEALKAISSNSWQGVTIHDNIEKCLTAINLYSCSNSGWYKPAAAKFPGVSGIFMVNENGSICCDARIMEEENGQYKIEYLTSIGYKELENKLDRFLEEN